MRLHKKADEAGQYAGPGSYSEPVKPLNSPVPGDASSNDFLQTPHDHTHLPNNVDENGVPITNQRRQSEGDFSRKTLKYRNFSDYLEGRVTEDKEGWKQTEMGVNDPFSYRIQPPKSFYVSVKGHIPSFLKKILFVYTQYAYHAKALGPSATNETLATTKIIKSYLQDYLDFFSTHLGDALHLDGQILTAESSRSRKKALKIVVDLLNRVYHEQTPKSRYILDISDNVRLTEKERTAPPIVILVYDKEGIDKDRSLANLEKEFNIQHAIANSYGEDYANEVAHAYQLYVRLISVYSLNAPSPEAEEIIESVRADAETLLEYLHQILGKADAPKNRTVMVVMRLIQEVAKMRQRMDANMVQVKKDRLRAKNDATLSEMPDEPENLKTSAFDLSTFNYIKTDENKEDKCLKLSSQDISMLQKHKLLLIDGTVGVELSGKGKAAVKKTFDYKEINRLYESVKQYYDVNDTLYDDVSVDLYLVSNGLHAIYDALNMEYVRKPVKPPVQVGDFISLDGTPSTIVAPFIVVSYSQGS